MGDRTTEAANTSGYVWINRIYIAVDVLWIVFYTFLGYRLWVTGSFLHSECGAGYMGLKCSPLWLPYAGIYIFLIVFFFASIFDNNKTVSRKDKITHFALSVVALLIAPIGFAIVITQAMN